MPEKTRSAGGAECTEGVWGIDRLPQVLGKNQVMPMEPEKLGLVPPLDNHGCERWFESKRLTLDR